MRLRALQLALLPLFIAAFPLLIAGQSVRYSVPQCPWSVQYGNHRAVLHVAHATGAVYVRIPWRRRDSDPARKRIIIVDSLSGQTVSNILRISITKEKADLVFEPLATYGTYFVYYLPYKVQTTWGWYEGEYLTPEGPPDQSWIREHKLSPALDIRRRKDIPEARVITLQSRTPFDSFYPMELPATDRECARLLKGQVADYLLFPEDRSSPIRMKRNLPLVWVERGPSSRVEGRALRNEYYVFQVGLFAARKDLDSIAVECSDLTSRGSLTAIPANAVTCFNLGGVDARGHLFHKRVDVKRGLVQALWFGVDIPRETSPGEYTGELCIRPRNAKPQTVSVRLTVTAQILEDRGDGEPWRHSRLRWLNSRAGNEDTVIPPYEPLTVEGNEIRESGNLLEVGNDGLPAKIIAGTTQVIASPIRFMPLHDGTVVSLEASRFSILESTPGHVRWVSQLENPQIRMICNAKMEFDGSVDYNIQLTGKQDVAYDDVRLEIPFCSSVSEYMIGMGREGAETPEKYEWKWKGPQDSFWMGNTLGGIHCELRGGAYHGPLLNLYLPPPPPSWDNKGLGGFSIVRDEDRTVASVYTGPRRVQSGETVTFAFRLLITPVKPLNTVSQFHDRYFHFISPQPEDLAAGIKVINVHHGYDVNPFINYPFLRVDTLRSYIRYWHERGMKVKIYYTVRELTNAVTELWALRSLGEEVLAGGPGGGYPWLREHLESDYAWGWYNPFPDSTADAALVTTGESRWYNYYIEGLSWLVRNAGIDGLYLDDVTYDRTILQRMKRVMMQARPGCIIDLHSNTGFSVGPANQYAEFFPYLDKLWFGESFQYNKMSAANWLVEVSGIPFGLMGDMLQDCGNAWRGMVFGMTVRYPWVTEGIRCDPRPIWRIWDLAGIESMEMFGYWDRACPVRTDQKDVLATVYRRHGRALIAIASWAPRPVEVGLSINFQLLQIDSARAVFSIPAVEGFQESRRFQAGERLRVEPGKGWMILVQD